MSNKKLILVGVPGSGIECIDKLLKTRKKITYFTNAPQELINLSIFKKYKKHIETPVINEIYNNNFYINMYNSLYDNNIYTEGIDLDSFEKGDILLTTPFEFINIPVNILKESHILWLDCNYTFIKNNIVDINQYIDYASENLPCNESMTLLVKDINYLYFFNETIETVAAICNVLLEHNDDINNIIYKGFK